MAPNEEDSEEKERSRIMVVPLENFRGLLGIKRMNKIPNALISEFRGMAKGMDEKIDETVFSPVVRPCGKNGEC